MGRKKRSFLWDKKARGRRLEGTAHYC